MRGKTCVVTGATGGIGKATAVALAEMGARIVLVARDSTRGDLAAAEIKAKSGNGEVEVVRADLSSLDSVRNLAAEIGQRYPKLHVLVNNAGGVNMRRRTTVDGLELTFATNHLSHFLLTNLLMPLLKLSAPARIITVSSHAHRRGHIDFDDLQAERHYRGVAAYGQSKLANILFTYELARRLVGTQVTANCLHPGVVATSFGRGPGWLGLTVRLLAPFLLSAEEGARTSVYLCSSPHVEGASGKYFVRCKERLSSRYSYDAEAAKRLWEVSLSLTGLDGTLDPSQLGGHLPTEGYDVDHGGNEGNAGSTELHGRLQCGGCATGAG